MLRNIKNKSLSIKANKKIKTNPGGRKIFRTHPKRPWGPPSLLYNGYRVSFPGVKRPGRDVKYPLQSSAEFKKKSSFYLYSPSGPSRLVLGRNLPLPFITATTIFVITISFYVRESGIKNRFTFVTNSKPPQSPHVELNSVTRCVLSIPSRLSGPSVCSLMWQISSVTVTTDPTLILPIGLYPSTTTKITGPSKEARFVQFSHKNKFYKEAWLRCVYKGRRVTGSAPS